MPAYCLALIFCLLYLSQILFFIIGWRKWKSKSSDAAEIASYPTCCIIVPARNEEKNIEKALQSIIQVNYPKELLSIIVVDDFSDDNTSEIVFQYQNHGVQLLRLSECWGGDFSNRSSKKLALDYAVKFNRSEIILCTDADCTVPSQWVLSYVKCFQNKNCKYVTGPIAYNNENAFLKAFQVLDLYSLNAITAACIGNDWPVMSNGANMGFRREDYLTESNSRNDLHINSGDDMFLMHAIHQRFRGSVFYQNSATVITSAATDFSSFWNQRVRWLSKSYSFSDVKIPLMLVFNFFFSALFIWFGLLSILGFQHSFYAFIFMLLTKTIADAVFLFLSIPSNSKFILLSLPFIEILYLLYSFLVGIASRISRFSWKGRVIKS